MIYLNTKVESLERKHAVALANMALRWCRTNMGTNNRKKYQPIWSVRIGWDSDCGEYDATDNEVHIYYNNCHDVRELIGTCIHEWTHQLQPILTKYDKYPGTYSRNPYERQARRNEDKYLKPCWAHIKQKAKWITQ
jgi:hypothetical protein